VPAAKTKQDLMTVTVAEYKKLEKLVSDYPQQLRENPDSDGVSPKDILGHRAHWIELFLGWYRDGQAGQHVDFPAPGYKWNQLKAYNADLRKQQSDLDWGQTHAMIRTAHDTLLTFLDRLDDAELYAAPMRGGNNDWPTGRWAEAAGASHYRSAAKYLRARKREPVY